jgi:hypothetical protein
MGTQLAPVRVSNSFKFQTHLKKLEKSLKLGVVPAETPSISISANLHGPLQKMALL